MYQPHDLIVTHNVSTRRSRSGWTALDDQELRAGLEPAILVYETSGLPTNLPKQKCCSQDSNLYHLPSQGSPSTNCGRTARINESAGQTLRRRMYTRLVEALVI